MENKTNEKRIQVGEKVCLVRRGKKGIYQADFWHNGKHLRRTLKTKNLKVARRRAMEIESELDEGLRLPTRTKKTETIAMKQAIDDFIEFQRTEGCRPKTITKYRGMLTTFNTFAQQASICDVGGVSLPLIDRYRAERGTKIGAKSMHNEAIMLKTFLGWCANRQYVAENPLADRRFKRPKHTPRGGPTLEQINKILDAASAVRMPLLATLAFAGMRAGELQHLLITDVDLESGWIQIVSRTGVETKTGESWRVPIHPRLMAILTALPRSRGSWFFTAQPSLRHADGGNHVNMKHVNEDFQKVLVKLGIPAGKKNGGFVLHSLRSSFKTIAINAGVPREIVDLWQGHKSHRPTASDGYYAPTDEDHQRFIRLVPFGDG